MLQWRSYERTTLIWVAVIVGLVNLVGIGAAVLIAKTLAR